MNSKNQGILKVGFLHLVFIGLRFLSSVLLNKLVAVFAGQQGLLVFGNLRNVLSLAEVASTGGMQSGILTLTASTPKNEHSKFLFGTIFSSIAVISLVLSVVVMIFHATLATWFFGSYSNGSTLVVLLALLLPLNGISLAIINIYNGLQLYSKVLMLNVYVTIISTFCIAAALIYYDLEYALYATIAAIVLQFVLTVFNANRLFLDVNFRFHSETALKLVQFGLTGVVSTVLPAVSFLYIRNELVSTTSTDFAANWEAAYRLSSQVALVFIGFVSLYFFPKISESIALKSTNAVFVRFLKIGFLPFFVGALILAISSSFLIPALYSADYLVAQSLFPIQLLGDVFRALAVFFGFVLLAQHQWKSFILCEFVSYATLLLGFYLFHESATTAVAWIYVLSNIVYLAVAFFASKFKR